MPTHLAWPLRRSDSSLATVEQDTQQEVAQCVAVVVSTPTDTFLHQPEFGVLDPLFSEVPVDLEPFEAAVDEFEPRAIVEFTDNTESADLALGVDRIGVLVTVDGAA